MAKLQEYIGKNAELIVVFENSDEIGGMVYSTVYHLDEMTAVNAREGVTSRILALRFEDGVIFPLYGKDNTESIEIASKKRRGRKK